MKIIIRTDPEPYNPRELDTTPDVMFCLHRRYHLGDKDALDPRELDPSSIGIRLPIYMYDHSGITIAHTPFSCPWDSGQLGEHYMMQSDIDDEFAGDREKALEYMRNQLKEYDFFLRNECWCWTTFDDKGEEIETMAGYFGDTLEETGIKYDIAEELQPALEDAWNRRFEK